MCKICDLRDSDDPREQAIYQAITDPRFAMMAAVTVNYLMQQQGIMSVDVPDNIDFTELPALLFENGDYGIRITRIAQDMILPLAQLQAAEREDGQVVN